MTAVGVDSSSLLAIFHGPSWLVRSDGRQPVFDIHRMNRGEHSRVTTTL